MGEYLEEGCSDCADHLPGCDVGNGKCSNCSGTGVEPLTPEIDCSHCGGSGECPTCHGSGTV